MWTVLTYLSVGLGDIEFVTCDYCMSYLLRLLQYYVQKLKNNHIVWKVCNVTMSACFHWKIGYRHNFFAEKLTMHELYRIRDPESTQIR